MFIEKARQLESAQAVAGIVIDNNSSLKYSNGALFSMSGDGHNNVHIPFVLMFKDEAFQLFNILLNQPDLIVYIGEENRLLQSFYQQIDHLETFIGPFNRTTDKWFYGQIKLFEKQCSILPTYLKDLEFEIKRLAAYNAQTGKIFE